MQWPGNFRIQYYIITENTMAFEAFGQCHWPLPHFWRVEKDFMNEWILFGILQILTQHFLREKVCYILGRMWYWILFTTFIGFVEKQILQAVFTVFIGFFGPESNY